MAYKKINNNINDVAKTANYDLLPNDKTIIFDTTSGNLNANLPSLATLSLIDLKRKVYTLLNVGSSGNYVSINANGADVIEGLTNLQLEDDAIVTIQSTGGVSPVWKVTATLNQNSNKYTINRMSDFPVAPDGSNNLLLPTSNIFINNPNFILTSALSVDTVVDSIVYIKAARLIIDVSGGATVRTADLKNSVINLGDNFFVDGLGNQSLFDIDLTTPGGTGALVAISNVIVGYASLGIVKHSVAVFDFIQALQTGTGLTLDSNSIISIESFAFQNSQNLVGAVKFTFQGDAGVVNIANITLIPLSNETAFDIKATSTVLAGKVQGATYSGVLGGTIFAAGSKDYTDPFWTFSGNVGIRESSVLSQLGFQNNTTTETVIDQVDVPVKINGVFITEFAERFLTDSSGSSIYIGQEDTGILSTLRSAMRPVSGISIELGLYIGETRKEVVEITFTNATNIVNKVGHGLSNDTSIRLSAVTSVPTGTRDDQFYYVINALADTFQISSTLGGAAKTFTDDGVGTQYYSLGGIINSSEDDNTASSTGISSFLSNSIVDLTAGPPTLDKGDIIDAFADNHDTTSNIIAQSNQSINNK